MGKFVLINEDYLAEYYFKRDQYNKLKVELDEMSEIIKSHLEHTNHFGYTYGKYVASVSIKNKLNSNFIEMLKETNMQDRITEVCYIKNCRDIIASFTKEDEDKYYDLWYKQLVVKKSTKV